MSSLENGKDDRQIVYGRCELAMRWDKYLLATVCSATSERNEKFELILADMSSDCLDQAWI